MKRLAIFLLCWLTGISSYAQIRFEPGYFIDNEGQKTTCLIKNIDWKNNPKGFEYKLTETDEGKKANIQDVMEFGVDNFSKYIRVEVRIDRSGNVYRDLTSERSPVFNNETLFLKVLMEGEASLCYYEEKDLRRFFYKVRDGIFEQLIYIKYIRFDNDMTYNNLFRQQLLTDLNCECLNMNDYSNLKYNKEELSGIFKKYNLCVGSKPVTFEEKNAPRLFNLKIKSGLGYTHFKIDYLLNPSGLSQDITFESKLLLKFGFEAEMILPFNRNKLSIVLEPALQSYSSSKEIVQGMNRPNRTVLATYNYLEVPLGIRYYLFLSKKSRVFFNGLYSINFSNTNAKVDFGGSGNLNLVMHQMSYTPALGLGFSHGKLSAEFRHYFNREMLENYTAWKSQFGQSSFVFGYKIF